MSRCCKLWKRRTFVVLLACMVVALTVVALLPRDHEPRYQGRSLSQWLHTPNMGRYPEEFPVSLEGQEAVHQLGTNAIPTLLQWISYEPSPFRTRIVRLLQKLPSRMQPRFAQTTDYRGHDAENAFFILGPAAHAAIPELTRLAIRSRGTSRSRHCITSLVHIGPEAVQAFTAIATNAETTNRFYAILFLQSFGTNALPAVPGLITCLTDKEPNVACAAAVVLGELALRPRSVIPALANSLQSTNAGLRAYAARALGGFGNEAKTAVPQLQTAMLDTYQLVREAATNALRKIALEALTNAPGS